MSKKPTKKEWLSRRKCKKCGFRLKMYEWGDWGHCTNSKCGIIWNMFQKP